MSVPDIQKILLVDDVQLIIEMEQAFLESSKIEILFSHDGESALEIVRNQRPSLVIMDINMPKLNGIACCAAIKGDPELAGTRVIMVSAANRADDLKDSWSAGCDDFIFKPLDRRIFLEKAHRFINSVDRRKKRVTFIAEVAMILDGRIQKASSMDLSYNGLYLVSELKPPVGTEITISFRLLDTSPAMTVAKCRVSWLNTSECRIKNNYKEGFGVEFVEVVGEGLGMLRVNELKDYVELRKSRE